jgi:hypothetical protein
MSQALLVLAIDHARAPERPADYDEIGQQTMKKKVARVLVGSHTKATRVEAVEQAKTPITFPISTNRAVSNVPIAAYLHRDNALQSTRTRQ